MRRKDPLDAVVKRIEELAKKEVDAACKHPHVHFQKSGSQIRCIDCKRYWIAGWKTPKGLETTITDFAYMNPYILDHEFRHSPNEPARQSPLPDPKPKDKKKIR